MPAASAVLVYFVATGVEIAVIEALRPTEIELTWISDAVLALAFGSAMFLWLHLKWTRIDLGTREWPRGRGDYDRLVSLS
jgi:hypothetical protein